MVAMMGFNILLFTSAAGMYWVDHVKSIMIELDFWINSQMKEQTKDK